jgi:hypothetical protein
MKKIAKGVMKDPLTKELLEDEKKVAKKTIGRVESRTKKLVEEEKKVAKKAIGKASEKAKKFVEK